MKKLIYISLIGLILTSCTRYHEGVVYKIDSFSYCCVYKYHTQIFQEGAMRISNGEKVDSCGKYNLGDTIKLTK